MAFNDRRKLTFAILAGLVLTMSTLSGCGRRGALEPPPNAQSTDPAYAVKDPVEAQKNAKPDRPFFLDRLL